MSENALSVRRRDVPGAGEGDPAGGGRGRLPQEQLGAAGHGRGGRDLGGPLCCGHPLRDPGPEEGVPALRPCYRRSDPERAENVGKQKWLPS